MLKFSRFASLLLLPLVAAVPAQAGQKITQNVQINVYPWMTTASGGVGDARASSDSLQTIQCAVSTWPGYARGLCIATNKNNQTVSCYATDPELLKAIYSIGPNSYVYFSFPSGSTDCDAVTVENGSRYRPVAP